MLGPKTKRNFAEEVKRVFNSQALANAGTFSSYSRHNPYLRFDVFILTRSCVFKVKQENSVDEHDVFFSRCKEVHMVPLPPLERGLRDTPFLG